MRVSFAPFTGGHERAFFAALRVNSRKTKRLTQSYPFDALALAQGRAEAARWEAARFAKERKGNEGFSNHS